MQPDDDKTRSHVTLAGGTMVSHYRIVEKIGEGGMGEVYLAEDSKLNRKVALKFLPVHSCQNADHRARFTREAQAAAKLNHTNIVTIHEVSEFDGRPFFAMEHLEGESLSEYVKDRKPSWQELIGLAIQVVEGLGEAHRSGVIHRDIKPSNILVDDRGKAKILDFGLAAIKGEKKLTKTGSTLGTLHYMSPEQTRGEPLDERSDIFSFGVVFYEMITGQTPFRGEHEPAILYSIAYEEPEPLARYKSGVSEECQRIVSKALAKEKTARYQHADELAADLKRLISTVSSAPIQARRKRRVLVPATVVLVAALAILVFKPWRMVTEPERQTTTAGLRRVVVVPFKNETGDPSLDPIGKQVAARTSQGLMQVKKVVVIQPQASLGIDTISSIRTIAEAAGANRVVTGVYYKIGDSIQFQGQINDSTERLLAPVKPISVSPANIMDGVEEVRQRVMGALAQGGVVYQAILYEAVLEYQQGRELFAATNFADAITHFRRAVTIDTAMNSPWLNIFWAYANLGLYAEADSILKVLESRRTRMSSSQQLELDRMNAELAGDWMRQLALYRPQDRNRPLGTNWFMVGACAKKVNFLNEAVDAFKKEEAEDAWVVYWLLFAATYHMLGDHEEELHTIREGRRSFPTAQEVYNAELQALAAMGKITELRKLIEDRPGLPADLHMTATPAGSMRIAAIELRAHGYEGEAMGLFDEAIRWYEGQPTEKLSDAIKGSYAYTLYCARRWDEARVVYEELAKEYPRDSANGRGYAVLLGLIAARRGEKDKAVEVSDWLKNLKVPYLYGWPAYQRATIAATLGDKAQAVALLKESLLQGGEYGMGIHSDFDLESLWDYPPFIEFLKPKG